MCMFREGSLRKITLRPPSYMISFQCSKINSRQTFVKQSLQLYKDDTLNVPYAHKISKCCTFLNLMHRKKIFDG